MEKYKVLCGIDRIESVDYLLKDRKIALLTSASGVNKQGIPTYEILAKKYRLSYLLAPEHGLRSDMQDGKFGADELIPDGETGALICNLNSKGHSKLDEIISDCDIAVYDIQDVGARFYTYLCNLTQVMRACKRAGKPFLVLDRPNPAGGVNIEGAVLQKQYSSFIGEYSIPTRYGLTVGEYALFINQKENIKCEIHVLGCEGWRREMYYDDTDLLFVNPSPNIPSVNSIFNYFGSCIYEATNISEGRGTTRPFDLVGAPFVDSNKLYDEMKSYNLPGIIFRKVCFTPQFNKHAGTCCYGLELHVVDRSEYKPIKTMMYMFNHFRRYKEFEQRDQGLCLRFGTDLLLGNYDPEEFEKNNEQVLNLYKSEIKPYTLYDF